MKFTIAKLRHEQYGQSSERSTVLEQLELQLANLEEDASQVETEAQMVAVAAAEAKIKVEGFQRTRPARHALPEHLPRERIVHQAPTACSSCGSTALREIGEDVTETVRVGRRLTPPIERDPATTVVLVVVPFLSGAAVLHSGPRHVFGRRPSPPRMARMAVAQAPPLVLPRFPAVLCDETQGG